MFGVLESDQEERVRHELVVHFEARAQTWIHLLYDFWGSFVAEVEIDLEVAR